ncbi:MAG: ATP-dependent helicase HrpA, partial [Paraburkholderia sp.]|nr:ATP-dependent helicase HrpA [Paraburkholderia sp.]
MSNVPKSPATANENAAPVNTGDAAHRDAPHTNRPKRESAASPTSAASPEPRPPRPPRPPRLVEPNPIPPITFPEALPVSGRRDEIAKAIAENQVVIVCGETGSGKTTQLPKICLTLGRG